MSSDPGFGSLASRAASPSNIRSRATSCAPSSATATREDNLPWLFVSERQAQLTRQAVNYIVRVAGETAKLGRVWAHMLRHSCGYYLADQGTDPGTMQDYLVHCDPGPLQSRCRTSVRGVMGGDSPKPGRDSTRSIACAYTRAKSSLSSFLLAGVRSGRFTRPPAASGSWSISNLYALRQQKRIAAADYAPEKPASTSRHPFSDTDITRLTRTTIAGIIVLLQSDFPAVHGSSN
jgi:Phage integrase family